MALVASTTPIPAHGPLTPFEVIAAELEAVRSIEMTSSADLAEMQRLTETIIRQATALSIDLLETSEHTGLHYQDGHTSAKTMARHVCKLSGAEAAGREKCRRMFTKLPLIADAYRSGKSLGTQQVMLLGRVFANPRVRGAMEGRQEWFLEHAHKLSYPRFEQKVRRWESLIDEDGPEPPGERTARNRTANINQNPIDLSWDLTANFTSVDGAFNSEVLRAYVQALFEADWAEAKARVGDTVSMADLGRTHAQRKADALTQIHADAIGNKNGMAPANFTHSIQWSASAYEEMARRFSGATRRPFDVDDFICETTNGDPLDPTEAFANSMINKIRRVIVDAKGVVIDIGRARFFTGFAKEALRHKDPECYWLGCWVPATSCESDHLHDRAKGGRTCPSDGAPACGTHNRIKQKGFRVWRDHDGQIRIQRPDGTEIE